MSTRSRYGRDSPPCEHPSAAARHHTPEDYGAIPLGAVLGGTLGTTLGLRTTMWIMVVGVALAPLTLLIGPTKRNRDSPDHPADAVNKAGELLTGPQPRNQQRSAQSRTPSPSA